MNGLLIYEEKDAAYNQSFITYMIEQAEKLDITLAFCLYEKFTYGIENDSFSIRYDGKPMESVDFVIYRSREYLLSRQFEAMGIHVFNNSKVCEICNDKAATYQYIASTGIKMVPSLFVKNSMIRQTLEKMQGEVVMKAVSGHGGSQVCLLDLSNEADVEHKIQLMNNENVVIQPLINGKNQDLRVYIIGGEIIAAVLRTANSGFKANFSLGGSVELYELSEAECEIINKVTSILSLDYAGIDFIIGADGELIFNEIEDVVGARMLYQCSDLDVVPMYLNHIKKVMNKL